MTLPVDMETVALRLGITFQPRVEDSQVDAAYLTRLPLTFARGNLLLPFIWKIQSLPM